MMTNMPPATGQASVAHLQLMSDTYEMGRLRIDFASYEVWLDGRPVHLSLRDFELLRFFVRSPNRVYDRSVILKLVWGNETHVTQRTVDVHVRRLRVRIERDAAQPELIVTVRGVGYRFNDRALVTETPCD